MISGVSMQSPKNFKDTASTVLINVIDFLLRKMEGGGESTIKKNTGLRSEHFSTKKEKLSSVQHH